MNTNDNDPTPRFLFYSMTQVHIYSCRSCCCRWNYCGDCRSDKSQFGRLFVLQVLDMCLNEYHDRYLFTQYHCTHCCEQLQKRDRERESSVRRVQCSSFGSTTHSTGLHSQRLFALSSAYIYMILRQWQHSTLTVECLTGRLCEG